MKRRDPAPWAWRHYHKTIAAWGDGADALTAAGISPDERGIEVGDRATKTLARAVIRGVSGHRHWERSAEGGRS